MAEAVASYNKARDIFIACDDQLARATADGQLGSLALELERLDEAETSYNEALKAFTLLRDHHRAAGTNHQLGVLAQRRLGFEEAEAAYMRSFSDYVKLGDSHYRNFVLISLARLWAAAGSSKHS